MIETLDKPIQDVDLDQTMETLFGDTIPDKIWILRFSENKYAGYKCGNVHGLATFKNENIAAFFSELLVNSPSAGTAEEITFDEAREIVYSKQATAPWTAIMYYNNRDFENPIMHYIT